MGWNRNWRSKYITPCIHLSCSVHLYSLVGNTVTMRLTERVDLQIDELCVFTLVEFITIISEDTFWDTRILVLRWKIVVLMKGFWPFLSTGLYCLIHELQRKCSERSIFMRTLFETVQYWIKNKCQLMEYFHYFSMWNTTSYRHWDLSTVVEGLIN